MMQQQESRQPCECDVCKVKHFERNNYFHGKMLTSRDLAAEQAYFNEKRWLINRMVLGWGIVCGLDVCQENGCLVLHPGLALDCCGRELLVCDREAVHPQTIAEAIGEDRCTPFGTVRWVLCLEYAECKIEPVKLPASCSQGDNREYNRIRDHYRLVFREWDDACPKDHNKHCCPYKGWGEITAHQAVARQSTHCPKCEECECVVLATGTLKTDPGREYHIELDDDYWKYRQVVYTNPALANLFRCFHEGLAHIKRINWTPNKKYDVSEFLTLLSKEHLRITFDRPMDRHTVREPRTFRLSVFIPVNDGNCPVQLLIPVDRVEYDDDDAVYYFDYGCIEHELRASCQRLRKPAEVELVLHGSMIRDLQGRALDAELIRDFPTGNGVEGGEFITYFTVVGENNQY
jgi:hypothetical protein